MTEGESGWADGRLFVKAFLLKHNRRTFEGLAEVVVVRVCRKRCRNLVSLLPRFSSFEVHRPRPKFLLACCGLQLCVCVRIDFTV